VAARLQGTDNADNGGQRYKAALTKRATRLCTFWARAAILCCEGNLIDLRCKAVSWCREGLRQCNAHCPEIWLLAGRVPDDATMGSMWEHRIEI